MILVVQLNIDIVLVNQFLQLINENILFFLQDECFVFQDACLSFDLLLCPFGVEWRREIERVRKWERERKERGRERGKDGGGDWSVVIRVFWISMTLKKVLVVSLFSHLLELSSHLKLL